jgi:hypothetical protein
VPEGAQAEESTTDSDPGVMRIGADDGGILEDTDGVESDGVDGGMRETLHHLIQAGCAGGRCSVGGGQQSMIESACGVSNVSLVVVDNVYLDKAPPVRKRLTRDLAGRLSDRLRVPVIGAEELKTRYLFGPKQWLQLVATAGLVGLLYLGVFSNQEAVLGFLRSEGSTQRILAVVAVAVTAPVVAYLWGTAAHHLLRLARFE